MYMNKDHGLVDSSVPKGHLFILIPLPPHQKVVPTWAQNHIQIARC